MCCPHIRIPQSIKETTAVRQSNKNSLQSIRPTKPIPQSTRTINISGPNASNAKRNISYNSKKIRSDFPLWRSELKKEDHHSVTNFTSLSMVGNFIHTKNVLFGTACENGNIDLVKKYFALGANIHYNNNYALKWACRNGHIDVVKFLVENGADIYADSNEPLQWASINNHLEIVEYLIEKDQQNILVMSPID